MANPYTFGALGERWTVDQATTKPRLDKSRIKADANRWTLQQIVDDPDDPTALLLAPTFADGTEALPSITNTGDLNTGLWFPAADTVALSLGGAEKVRFSGNNFVLNSSGTLFMGDSANGDQAVAGQITLNNGADLGPHVACKNTNTAHGVTDWMETDTAYQFQTRHTSYGGLTLRVACETGETSPWRIYVTGGSITSTKSAAGIGHIHYYISKPSGTGTQACGGTNNLVAFTDNGSTRHIFGADGDIDVDAVVSDNVWDDDDDLGLLNTFRMLTISPRNPNAAKEFFGEFMQEHADTLHKTGVLTLNRDGHHFVSLKGLHALEIDTIRQEGGKWRGRCANIEERLELEQALRAEQERRLVAAEKTLARLAA